MIPGVSHDALFGALVGGLSSLLGTLVALRAQRLGQEASERAELLAMITALREELRTVLGRFELAWGSAFVDRVPGTPVLAELAVGEDYLAVFHGHAGQLGRIGDDAAVRALVHAVVTIKGLLDAVRANNEMVRLTVHGALKPEDVVDPERRFRVARTLERLGRYGDVLAWSADEMTKATRLAIEALDRREVALRP